MRAISEASKPSGLTALLLECLHLDSGRPDTAAVASLDAEGWDRLRALAAAGWVQFQLYQRLSEPRLRASVPPAVLEQLLAVARGQTLRLLGLQATLAELLRACAEAQLPVMVLKGMHLGHAVYADAQARDMGDIDVLFRPRDLARATAVFASLGYPVPHGAGSLIDLAPANHEYTLVHPRLGSAVDVHWSLTDARSQGAIDEEPLWTRAEQLRLAGEPALVMAREDLLVHVCFHASHHHRFKSVGLRPLVDAAQICARTPRLDWRALVARARAWGWGRGAYLTLSLARQYLGAPVPAQALAALADAPRDLEQVQDAALASIFLGSTAGGSLHPNILLLWSNGSRRERLRLLFQRLFVPRAELIQEFGLSARQQLPVRPLLHLRRIGRLAKRHGPKIWALWRGDPARMTELDRQRRLTDWLDAPERGTPAEADGRQPLHPGSR